MRYVVLSLDYEIFGNGAGDARQHITEPTARMAQVAEKYHSPLTLFVEMEELLAFDKCSAELQRHCGYNPYQHVRQQVIDLVRRGHDAQLHLHPEWFSARFHQDRWLLDPSKGTVDSLFESVHEASSFIRQRKAALQEMIDTAGSRQRVVAYRAGAFSAQPSVRLIPALAENDFILDTSVVHGLTRFDDSVNLDYRNAPTGKTAWRVSSDVAVEDKAGPLWEVPIASVPGRRFQQATFGRLKAKFSRNVPKEQQTRMIRQLGVRKNPAQLVKFLAQRIPIKLDFHNVAPGKLLNWIRRAPAPPAGALDVVMLIGHSKEHLDDQGFGRLLAGIDRDPNLKVVGLSEIAAMLPSLRAPRLPAFPSPVSSL